MSPLQIALSLAGAAACFHLAYATPFGFCIFGFLLCLLPLARLSKPRYAFYAGVASGALCYPAQLAFFWGIFGVFALGLWMVLMVWLGFFLALAQVAWHRLSAWRAALLIPCLWTGLEYFRSELYYLRFSWMNIGFAVPTWTGLGVYTLGFAAALLAAGVLTRKWWATALGVTLVGGSLAMNLTPAPSTGPSIAVAGAQLEFPIELVVIDTLNELARKHPEAELLVLSEYTLNCPVSPKIKAWCRLHRKYLVIGGAEPEPGGNYFNTAYVVSPEGEIVFHQAKSVPIQFFKDGLPAREQRVWDSPWGKIGFCICYDLSYRRVTDGLVRLGAQAIIVPTMDVEQWGRHEHEIHARVAPTRASEYGLPIFRVGSSGISQLIDARGGTLATAPFAAAGATLAGRLTLTSGRMPVDAHLAPACTVLTGAFLIWLMVARLRRL